MDTPTERAALLNLYYAALDAREYVAREVRDPVHAGTTAGLDAAPRALDSLDGALADAAELLHDDERKP